MTQPRKVENIKEIVAEEVVVKDDEIEEEYVEELDDFEDLKEVEREMQARHPFPAAAAARQNYFNVTVKAVPFDIEVECSRWLNLDAEDDHNRNDTRRNPVASRSRVPKRRRERRAVPLPGERVSVIISRGSAARARAQSPARGDAGGNAGAPGIHVSIAVEDIPLPPPRRRWLSMEEQTQVVLAYMRDIYGPDYDFHQPPPIPHPAFITAEEMGELRPRN